MRLAAVIDDMEALLRIAERTGASVAQVRMVLAEAGKLPAEQVVRFTGPLTQHGRAA